MRKFLLVAVAIASVALFGCAGDSKDGVGFIGVGDQFIGSCGTGDGSWNLPYVLCTSDDLARVRNNLMANYALKNDIAITTPEDWQPIGSRSFNFNGTFNGNGYSITNLKIAQIGVADYQGLFGYISGGTVRNLKVQLAPTGIEGRNFVGGIAGKIADGGKIINCAVTGNLSGRDYVGGIVGEVQSSTVSSSVSRGEINASGLIGGIAGKLRENSKIENCYSEMDINAQNYVGGIVGEASKSVVAKSYAVGSIIGSDTSSTHIGGIVGVANESEVLSVFALNERLLGRIFINRVVGGFVLSAESNNFAVSSLILFGLQNAGVVGTTISDADAKISGTYENVGWAFGETSDAPWQATGGYPKLFIDN